jgi:zinc protease
MTTPRTRRSAPAAAGALAALLCAAVPPGAAAEPATAGGQGDEPMETTTRAPAIETVALPEPDSPLVAVRLLFRTGSIDDPRGKEGLAALTALMVGDAGTARRSYAELIDALYPLAAAIDVAYDREVTVVSGVVHRDTLADYTALLLEAVLAPGFAAADFQRNREALHAHLTATLRAASDELLGLEALQDALFAGHPYGHPEDGTVRGLAAVTLDDVRRFYAERYTRSALILGVAGGYPEGYVERLAAALGALPAGEPGPAGEAPLPPPPAVEGRRFTLIDKPTAAVGIHLGYPLPLTRADADYYPLMVAGSFLGEHRTFHGRLMQQLRGERGLNYGDYAYIEHYHNPPGTSLPTPNVPRRQQYFSIWVRPVVPPTAHFALRAALHELDRLIDRGLTREEFELTRTFLVHYSKLWAQTLSRRLGFHLDSRFYGAPYWIDEIERRLAALSLEDVNRAVKKYLTADRYRAVVVGADAAALAGALFADAPSPISYEADVPADVLAADQVIQARKVAPTAVEIVPAATLFEE